MGLPAAREKICWQVEAVSCGREHGRWVFVQDFLEVCEAKARRFGNELIREGVGELESRVALELLLPVLHVQCALRLIRVVEGAVHISIS